MKTNALPSYSLVFGAKGNKSPAPLPRIELPPISSGGNTLLHQAAFFRSPASKRALRDILAPLSATEIVNQFSPLLAHKNDRGLSPISFALALKKKNYSYAYDLLSLIPIQQRTAEKIKELVPKPQHRQLLAIEALKRKHVKMLQILTATGIDYNFYAPRQDDFEISPLMVAIFNKDRKAFDHLMKLGTKKVNPELGVKEYYRKQETVYPRPGTPQYEWKEHSSECSPLKWLLRPSEDRHKAPPLTQDEVYFVDRLSQVSSLKYLAYAYPYAAANNCKGFFKALLIKPLSEELGSYEYDSLLKACHATLDSNHLDLFEMLLKAKTQDPATKKTLAQEPENLQHLAILSPETLEKNLKRFFPLFQISGPKIRKALTRAMISAILYPQEPLATKIKILKKYGAMQNLPVKHRMGFLAFLRHNQIRVPDRCSAMACVDLRKDLPSDKAKILKEALAA